ncbi:PREDICTED: uncharacterized protein LOC105565096 isoform X1 [Vollenhovia emeryi]|uniref:uncharacterized protein LOC105565096 isoform X1 n=1 Tax=Vollenhovia emeryi TaxID=411798 RepID=UPI0005F3A92F|nr:PREDICTED: uncharacterized protein LOC105565096 isoform X1 [Vollenhovia emeryi]XP_011873378.1 PREDICTED: uncharacterized protein LOC105565096 isoform X1 [Vollenhovia emeryi]
MSEILNMTSKNMKTIHIENAEECVNITEKGKSHNLNSTAEETLPKQTLVDTGCRVDVTSNEDRNNTEKKLKENTWDIVVTTSPEVQMSLSKEKAAQTDDIEDDRAKKLEQLNNTKETPEKELTLATEETLLNSNAASKQNIAHDECEIDEIDQELEKNSPIAKDNARGKLTRTKEKLSKKKQNLKKLEIHLENLEKRIAKLLNFLEQKDAETRLVENA